MPVIRLSSRYAGIYPGPTYLINVVGYVEDGILHIYAEAGYPGPHATNPHPHVGARVTGGISGTTLTLNSVSGYVPIGAYVSINVSSVGQIISQSSGTLGGAGVYVIENPNGISVAAHTRNISINGGVNYLTESSVNGGMLGEQFIDYYTCVVDSTAASRAAPFGVTASCNKNTVTISWLTTPLGAGAETQSYNVYRGDANSQTTLVGNTASTSITDTPTPGQQWWYKVVKVSNGVERKYRVVHTYVG